MNEKAATNLIDVWNLVIAATGLVVAFCGFGLAFWTLQRGNRNSSAALVHSMQVGFNQAWEGLLVEENPVLQPVKLQNLMGLMETSAAIHCDTALTGNSGRLMEEYLRDVLGHIADTPGLPEKVLEMRRTSTTFEYLDRFIDAMDRRGLADKFLSIRGARPHKREGFVYERRKGLLKSVWHNVKKPDFPGYLPLFLEHLKTKRRSGR